MDASVPVASNSSTLDAKELLSSIFPLRDPVTLNGYCAMDLKLALVKDLGDEEVEVLGQAWYPTATLYKENKSECARLVSKILRVRQIFATMPSCS